MCLALALRAQGRDGEARMVLLDAVARAKKPSSPGDRALRAALLAAAGRRAEARVLTDRVASDPALGPDDRYTLAEASAQAGDAARALRFLEEALASGYGDPYSVVTDPALALIRDDPAVERVAPPVPPA
jgi:hypothetical protein